jgi:tetratricopeptide (TPR) repeat protein
MRWLNDLEAEHDNLRAAMAWAVEHELDMALRMGGSLWRFWQFRGHLREAGERLEALLDRPGPSDPEARAGALEGAGGVAYWMGDFPVARRRYEECLEIRQRLGQKRGIAEAKYNLSFAHGIAPKPLQDLDTAMQLQEEALALFEDLGDREGVAKTTWGLSSIAYSREDWDRVAELASTSADTFRELENRFSLGWALHLHGLALSLLGRLDESASSLREAMEIFLEADDRSALALLLADLAILAGSRGDVQRAIRLAGAADSVEKEVGTGLLVSDAGVAQRLHELPGLLPSAEADGLFQEGQAMSMDEALAYAKEVVDPAS